MSQNAADIDPYASLPELYDLEHAAFDDDIDLYLQFAEVVGDPILELGCGTGRVLVPLAEAGYRVTGLDRSGPMLQRAAEATAGLRDRVTLVEAPMASADAAPGGPFGLVLLTLNGLLHLPTVAEQRAVLEAARRALDPRGMLVIDVLSPSPDILAIFDGRVQHEGAWQREDGMAVDRFSARTHAPSTQRIDTDLWFDLVDPSGRLTRIRSEFPMRYVTRSELELLLEISGFVEWRVYGAYDLEPYGDTSERLIVTAEVTPSGSIRAT